MREGNHRQTGDVAEARRLLSDPASVGLNLTEIGQRCGMSLAAIKRFAAKLRRGGVDVPLRRNLGKSKPKPKRDWGDRDRAARLLADPDSARLSPGTIALMCGMTRNQVGHLVKRLGRSGVDLSHRIRRRPAWFDEVTGQRRVRRVEIAANLHLGDREVAAMCGVSLTYVATIRRNTLGSPLLPKPAPVLPLTDEQRLVVAKDDSIKFARRVAARYAFRSGVPLDECLSPAFDGLVDAAAHYDPARGIPFTAFAAWRVKGAIIDHFRRNPGWSRRGHCRHQIDSLENLPIHERDLAAPADDLPARAEFVAWVESTIPDPHRRYLVLPLLNPACTSDKGLAAHLGETIYETIAARGKAIRLVRRELARVGVQSRADFVAWI